MMDYTCPVCGKNFESKIGYETHKMTHGSKGGSSSLSNKTVDAVEDLKNAAGDLGRDIKDDLID